MNTTLELFATVTGGIIVAGMLINIVITYLGGQGNDSDNNRK